MMDAELHDVSCAQQSGIANLAYAYLISRGESAALDVVVRHALALITPAPVRLVEQIADLLKTDVRFQFDADSHLSLTDWQMHRIPINRADFVVLDVESNGGRSGRHRVIELAGIRINGGREQSEYSSLVKLGKRLPRFISDMTGIESEQLTEAPAIEEVLAEFAEFSMGAILVSHNLPADLAYLNQEAMWAGTPRFPASGLDTMELLAALTPGHRQLGLVAGLEYFGIKSEAQHRALPDARNTLQLFLRLLEMARVRGMNTIKDLRTFALTAGNPVLPRQRAKLARWASLNLPALPGVYVFRSVTDEPLYVGKSRSLQRRVRSHFTGVRGRSKRWQGLLDATASIDHQVAGSDFAAMLLEVETILALSPTFNVQLQRRLPRRLVRLGSADNPSVSCVTQVAADDGIYAGPYRTGADGQSVAAMLRHIFEMPARHRTLEFRSGVPYQAAACFVTNGSDATVAFLEKVLDDDRDVAQRILRRLRRVHHFPSPVPGGLAGVRAIVCDHGPNPDEVEFFAVDHGKVTGRETLSSPSRKSVSAVVSRMVESPREIPLTSQSSTNFVIAWLHQHFGDRNVLIVPRTGGFDRIQLRIWRQVRELIRV